MFPKITYVMSVTLQHQQWACDVMSILIFILLHLILFIKKSTDEIVPKTQPIMTVEFSL